MRDKSRHVWLHCRRPESGSVKIVGADGQKEEVEGEYYVKSCPRYTVA